MCPDQRKDAPQVMDDGIEQGDDSGLPGTAHPDIIGRIVGLDNATGDPKADSRGGHGSFNACLILATVYAQSGRYRAAAIATAKALDLEREFGDARRAADLEQQLAIYEKLAGPASSP